MLFTFPSQYLSAIGLQGVFSLGGWSRPIHTGFLVSRATWDADRPRPSSRKGLSPAMARLSRRFRSTREYHGSVPQPRQGRNPVGLGWSPVARHYWGNHFCFLFLRVLRCFSSPGSPPAFTGCRSFRPAGCPIRKSRRQGPFAPRPGLSQLVTSFIACKSLGIRQMPLPTSFTLACWPTSISIWTRRL